MEKKSKNISKGTLLGLFLVSMIIVAGCTAPVNPGNGGNNSVNTVYTQEGLFEGTKVESSTFRTKEEYSNFIRDYSSGSGGGYYGRGVMLESVKSTDVAMAPSAANDGDMAGGSIDYSETNNQVAGVDEADMLKTDGEYIYTITDNTVFIVKAYPGKDAEVVSKIKFDNNYPVSLFIKGDKLAVIGNINDFDFLSRLGFSRNQGYIFMNIYDVSDRENPELLKELKFEGYHNWCRDWG